MDRVAQLAIFVAETKNVQRLEGARLQVRRAIDVAMRRGDEASEEAHSVVLTLLYCAWLEALFVKITHTPYGLDLPGLEAIRKEHDATGVHRAWLKCVDVGLARVAQGRRGNELPNMRQRLTRLLEKYVQEPATLRNKIAHGQWAVALNSARTAVNPMITAGIEALDVVTVERWFEAAKRLAGVIEALIESPARAFRRDYWTLLEELEAEMDRRATWTRDSRIVQLRKKPIPRPR